MAIDTVKKNIIDKNNPLSDDAQKSLENNGDSTEESNNTSTNKQNENSKTQNNEEIKDDVIVEENFTSAKESTGGKLDTETLISDVAKLESTLESKQSNTPDVSSFNKNLKEYLTEDELNLKHEDNPPLYLDAVEKLKKITHYLRTLNMEKEIILKEAQTTSLTEQTEDNRIIKNMSELAEYVNTLGNNELIAGATFHKNFMVQQKALLLKNGFTFTDGKVFFKINNVDVEIGTWDDNPTTTAQT
jgi:hypothetical protein